MPRVSLRIKRVYEKPRDDDGVRILVDRLWPRGLSREAARVDQWMKDIAPSDELRKWFAHREERWQAFRKSYLQELARHDDRLKEIAGLSRRGPVTLVYAAKDEKRNNAVVLHEYLTRLRTGP